MPQGDMMSSMRRTAVCLFLVACGARTQLRGTAVADGGAHASDGGSTSDVGATTGLVTLAQHESGAWALALDESSVYWTTLDSAGHVATCNKDGTGYAVLASPFDFATAIAVNGSTVYFTSQAQAGSGL